MPSSSHNTPTVREQGEPPKTGCKAQASVKTGPKKHDRKIWYQLRQKTRRLPGLLQLPGEVLWIIFGYVFIEATMVDIKTTTRCSIQRRRGAQSLLFVCKQLREIATATMFRYAIFEVSHFKLHSKHRRENPMTTLNRVQNLTILWTPAPSASFTTKRGDDMYILQNVTSIRNLTVWLLASQHLRLSNISRPDRVSRDELHDAMLAKFEPSVASQPRWLKRLLRDAPSKHQGIKMSLVGFFAFGLRHGEDLQAAHILWPSKQIVGIETVTWADWQQARAGFLNKRFPNNIQHWLPIVTNAHMAGLQRLGLAISDKFYVRPWVGDRAFGRKTW